jgi:ribA/ribD-fused uncharacterized protein
MNNTIQTPPPDSLGSPSGSSRVDFWAKRTGNFWLSNFYPAPITWDGKEWPTSEHLYQSLKVRSERDKERIRLAPTPKQAKELAHEIGYEIDVPGRAYLMRIAIREKFRQHPNLAEQLVATRGLIVEASPFDPLWGEGPRGCGLNLMGMLLMELRETLRENTQDQPR